MTDDYEKDSKFILTKLNELDKKLDKIEDALHDNARKQVNICSQKTEGCNDKYVSQKIFIWLAGGIGSGVASVIIYILVTIVHHQTEIEKLSQLIKMLHKTVQ
jgi:hypothetical protein